MVKIVCRKTNTIVHIELQTLKGGTAICDWRVGGFEKLWRRPRELMPASTLACIGFLSNFAALGGN